MLRNASSSSLHTKRTTSSGPCYMPGLKIEKSEKSLGRLRRSPLNSSMLTSRRCALPSPRRSTFLPRQLEGALCNILQENQLPLGQHFGLPLHQRHIQFRVVVLLLHAGPGGGRPRSCCDAQVGQQQEEACADASLVIVGTFHCVCDYRHRFFTTGVTVETSLC